MFEIAEDAPWPEPRRNLLVEALGSSASERLIVALDPWVSAYPLPPLGSLTQVFDARTAEQQPTEAPWVRMFQVR